MTNSALDAVSPLTIHHSAFTIPTSHPPSRQNHHVTFITGVCAGMTKVI
jgi:hypothetical protein